VDLKSFGDIAPHLGNPLVLAGFGLFLFFSIHRLLIKSGILPPLAQTDAPAIIKALLRYGFMVAIVIIVLGFLYSYLSKTVT
jgi:hypothetical protein